MDAADRANLQEVPLLSTKYNLPPSRPDHALVRRQHLLERLDAGLLLTEEGTFGRKLTLLSAPAGFGKTTLLSDWMHSRPPQAVAWLSLEEEDNDPARFLSYLVAALRQVKKVIGAGLLRALSSSQPPGRNTIMGILINEIATHSSPVFLVLDDYHLITSQRIHQAISFLLDHIPSNLHLVIATRADPPLPIARLRGRGQLAELRLRDLRFSPAEAGDFFNRVMALGLSPNEVDSLASRTEGWAAGLQLAAVSIRGQDEEGASLFVRAFTGSDRHVLDYLVEEVLGGHTSEVQNFLLRTAILDRLCGPLCDAILETVDDGGQSSQSLLEYLEAANLFIVPLDNERRWYRYHRLFADLLRGRLALTQPDLIPALHGRASRWHLENDLVGPAIEHAIAARQMERAADLIETVAEKTLMRSEVATLLRWSEKLPKDLIQNHPTLATYLAWALLLGGRPFEEVEAHLEYLPHGMQQLPDSDDVGDQVTPQAAPLLAFVSLFQGQLDRSMEYARLAREFLVEDDLFLYSMATWILGLCRLSQGNKSAGIRLLDEADQMSRRGGNLFVTVMALCYSGELSLKQGLLEKAEIIYRQALEMAVDHLGQPLPIAGEAMLGLGLVALEQNRLEAADRYLTEGIALSKRWGEIAALDGYLALARLRQAQKDPAGARAVLDEAEQLAIRFDATEMDDLIVNMQQAELAVMQNDLETARRWAASRKLSIEGARRLGSPHYPHEEPDEVAGVDYHLHKYEYLVLARLFLAQGRPEDALEVLAPVQTMMERRGRIGNLIQILLLEVLALDQIPSRHHEVMPALDKALSIAKNSGYLRIFLDEGPPMLRLLREAAEAGISSAYVQSILEAAGRPDLTQRPTPSQETLVDPLSQRELEVLALLSQGLSNKEIAGELVVAPSTVKQHLKNIYGKLDVHSRTQAVGRSRDLNLLP